MSEPFAEATIRVEPDLRGFVTKLRTEVRAAISKVEGTPATRVRIAPALTRDFVGDLRRQVNAAVLRVKPRPIQISATIAPLSQRQIRELERVVRVTRAPVLGAAAAPTAAGARSAAIQTNNLFAASEQRINQLKAQGARLLGQEATAQEAATAARRRGISSAQQNITALIEETAATRALAEARVQLSIAQAAGAGTAERERAIRAANTAALRAAALDPALRGSVEVFQRQLRTIPGATQALDEHSRAAVRAAQAHSQLRRGALSSGLSLLGIRGATLAASARFLVAAAAVTTFAQALQGSAAFEQNLAVFRATAGATADEMERVSASARALGRDLTLPGVSSADAAEAMAELAKAGLSVEDAIAGARGVLQLATAAAISNSQAVELAANAINAFGLAGRDATAVADTFANAANAAQGSIVDIGTAFQQASAAGRQSGLSFQDTATFLTVLARNGLRGSDAGTSLRTALIRLIRPSEEAARRMRALGIEIRDANGNIRPEIFQNITQAVAGLGPAARDSFIAMIGGQDAFRAISILGRQSTRDLIRLRAELRQQGTAAELAEARMEGLRGAFEAFGNSAQAVGNRIGAAVGPGIASFVRDLAGGLDAFGQNRQVGTALSGVADAVRALAAATRSLVEPAKLAASALAGVANSIGVANILAAVAAYKLLPPVFRTITGVGQLMVSTIGISALAGINPLTFAIRGLVSSMNFWVIAAAAVSAGLFALATRESAAERATRQLRESFGGLASAMGNAQAAADRLFAARRGASQLGTGVESAILEQRRAQAELAASTAPRGSFERAQLENRLAVAMQSATFAIQDQARAQRELNAAQEEFFANQDRLRAARQDVISGLTNTFEDVARRTRIFGFRGATPGEVGARNEARARRELLRILDEESDRLRESDDANERSVGNRIALIEQLIAQMEDVPSEKELRFLINAEDFTAVLRSVADNFGVQGDRATALFVQRVQTALSRGRSMERAIREALEDVPVIMAASGQAGGDAFTRAAAQAIEAGSGQVEAAVGGLARRLGGRISGIQRQATTLEIQGAGPAARIANLREEQALLERQIAAMTAGPARERRRERLAQVLSEIRSLQEQMANDAEAAAREARSRQDEIFQNILAAMGLTRDRRQELIQDAQLTEGVADDLAATRALRRVAARQIASLKERIANARAQGKNVQVLIEGLRNLREIWRDLGRTIRDLRQTRQEELRERAAESIQLDIEFAQTTENRRAEIAARQREIRRLQALISQTKKGTVEYKRYRNAIAEQRKAIEDLRKENDDKNRAFQQMAFSFLTTLQGFSANVMSNMLGFGATAGTLGGTRGGITGPSAAVAGGSSIFGNIAGAGSFGGGLGEALIRERLRQQGGGGGLVESQMRTQGQAAAEPGGISAGQAATMVALMRQMVRLLADLHRGHKHPEARKRAAMGGSSMDTM